MTCPMPKLEDFPVPTQIKTPQRFQITMDESLYRRIKIAAGQRGLTMSGLICTVMSAIVPTEKEKHIA